jgi:multiple sugar transport system substrate-binding protein
MQIAKRRPSRRTLIRAADAAGLAASICPFLHVRPARAAKTLRILQWRHFVAAYDRWFRNEFAKAWGEKNDTEVIVDTVNIEQIPARAAAEAAAQHGHDLVLMLSPPALYEDQVVDMKEVYDACEKRQGKPIDLALRSSYNPKTKKYFAFCGSFVPAPLNYRSDLWSDVGVKPDSWENIRLGGKKIKDKHGIPLGIGLAAEHDSANTMRTIMDAFGAHEQDADGNLTINTKATLEALKFVKALYHEAMTPDVLGWDASANNRQMLTGKSSLAISAISITRAGEDARLALHKKIALAKPATGPARQIGLAQAVDCSIIWKFAENIDGAKQFLVDYVDSFRKAFLASAFYNVPCFAKTVPDLKELVAKDSKAVPSDKYAVLVDANAWTTNLGDPGYANAAVAETLGNWTLAILFAKTASGTETPEDALAAAEKTMQATWRKWKERKMI